MDNESNQIANKKVVFCLPTVTGPYPAFIESLEASIPLIVEAGWGEGLAQEVGNPYISAARAGMARKALDQGATHIVFLDHDLSWDPQDLLTLLETEGDVVAGTYRFKCDEEKYMGSLFPDEDGCPVVRESDGALKSLMAPAGFLKVSKNALVHMARRYPELLYGDPFNHTIDLFNHGVKNGVWWGEDYAFCLRWHEMGGEIWTPPNMNVNHHTQRFVREEDGRYRLEFREFKGNLHKFLLRQIGGSEYQGDPLDGQTP